MLIEGAAKRVNTELAGSLKQQESLKNINIEDKRKILN